MAFSDFIQKHAMTAAELPLVHATEYFRLASIQTSHTLETSICRVFNEPLLYLFYGRPAYRDASQTGPTRDIGLYPICFIFKPGTLYKKAKRLYPFDTGASQLGLYEPAIRRTDALRLYPVPAVVASARKLVMAFFETDQRYLSNDPRAGLMFSPSETEAEAYYKLINGGGDPSCDDRSSAVEIQIAENIDLRTHVWAVALPTSFLEDDALLDALVKVWGAVPLTYPTTKGMRPLEFHGAIQLLVRDFYRQEGII